MSSFRPKESPTVAGYYTLSMAQVEFRIVPEIPPQKPPKVPGLAVRLAALPLTAMARNRIGEYY